MRKLKIEEIKRRIDATGMKPAPWAVAHGLNDESVRMWLKGGRNPKIGSIRLLADALKCDVADISEWVIEIDFGKLREVESEVEEIRHLWGYLPPDQRMHILSLIRTIAEPAIKAGEQEE